MVINVYDLLTEKVVNFSLRPPAFDLLFLVKKGRKWKTMTFQWPIVRVTVDIFLVVGRVNLDQ